MDEYYEKDIVNDLVIKESPDFEVKAPLDHCLDLSNDPNKMCTLLYYVYNRAMREYPNEVILFTSDLLSNATRTYIKKVQTDEIYDRTTNELAFRSIYNFSKGKKVQEEIGGEYDFGIVTRLSLAFHGALDDNPKDKKKYYEELQRVYAWICKEPDIIKYPAIVFEGLRYNRFVKKFLMNVKNYFEGEQK